MPLNVVLFKKDGNTITQINPASKDDRISITSDNAKLPSGITDLKDLINALGSLAFEDYVALNVSDETNYGLVKIASADSASDETVPTSGVVHSVKQTADNAVAKTGNENVSGVKNFTNGVQINGQNISYNQSTNVFTYGAPIVPDEPEEEP